MLSKLKTLYFLRKPWMHTKEIALIERHLTPSTVMLEWGSGGSTPYFSKQVKEYHSIEHDAQWAEVVKKKVGDKVDYHHVAPNVVPWSKPSKYEEFRDYVEYVDKLGVPRFDAVLIDGRARDHCAKKILDYVDDKSIVFIHDFYLAERHYYGRVLEWYDVADAVKDTERGIVALRKKRGA